MRCRSAALSAAWRPSVSTVRDRASFRRTRAPRVADFDRALSAVADWLRRDGRLDGSRIGIYGRATGSLLAIHGGARQALQGGGRASGGVQLLDFFEQAFVHTLVSHRLEMCSFFGASALAEESAWSASNSRSSTSPTVWIFVGRVLGRRRDDACKRSTILQQRVKGPVEIVTFPGKGHGGPSRLSLRWKRTGCRIGCDEGRSDLQPEAV